MRLLFDQSLSHKFVKRLGRKVPHAPVRAAAPDCAGGRMHCSRLAREFLHFRPISAHPAGPHQVIESTLLFDFLHLLHFLLPLPQDCTLGTEGASIDCTPFEVCAVRAVCDLRTQ